MIDRIALLAAAALLAASPALAETVPASPPSGRNVSSTGRVMPPASPRTGALKPESEAAMLKAQKAAETRNKAWDQRMQRTMGSICKGC
ncbi:hypothetical protein [Methylobacterium organophilum]|uniref:Uncharacterized protein n=1 Tax=Methylobacterium organophilum TaxID=410 RepID=A0ABQ4TBN9_METOR|nr:hypothetical protein [Methylobacterium organophilum]UMY18470.1 hypothetical protein MMB17_03780 [Methylobacterium organophilum]GJE29067.1 hypothetical protein LKMONMHP_3942 [Methylobacterium organophilum]